MSLSRTVSFVFSRRDGLANGIGTPSMVTVLMSGGVAVQFVTDLQEVFEERGAGLGSRAIIRRDHAWLCSKLRNR